MLIPLAESADASPVLVLFPHVGGTANTLRGFATALRCRNVFGIDYPGRGRSTRLPFASSVDELSTTIAAGLRERFGSAPISLLGHSFGGLVAFETARQMERGGFNVEALFVSSCASPRRILRRGQSLHGAEDAVVVSWLVENGGFPAELAKEAEFLEYALPIVRADIALYERYQVARGASVAVPIVCLGGVGDPSVSLSDLQDWQTFTSASCEVELLPGDHFHILHHVDAAASAVEAAAS